MIRQHDYLSFDAPSGSPAAPLVPSVESHREPPRRRLLGVAIAASASDLATSHALPGLGWTLGVLTLIVAFVAFVRPSTTASWAILAAAAVMACSLSLRESTWLIAPTVIAITVAFVLAATLADTGAFGRLSAAATVAAFGEFCVDGLIGWAWAAGPRAPGPFAEVPSAARRHLALGIGRGFLRPSPLWSSSDGCCRPRNACFAELIAIDFDLNSLPRHLIAWLLGYLLLAALARRSARIRPFREPGAGTGPALTATIALAGSAALFGLYAVSRASSKSAVAATIRQTAETTWSGQARAGFFQLLAVAAIMATVLLTVRSWSRGGSARSQRWLQRLATVNVVLVLGIVVDAYLRLRWYEQAYGWTMLRLFSVLFAVWLGAVFLLIAASFIGRLRGRTWLTPTILALSAAMLTGVALVNPEAVVAERNLLGSTRLAAVDTDYLTANLSADAVPTIVDNLDRLPSRRRSVVVDQLCGRVISAGGLEFNVARAEARSAVEPLCAARR